MPVAVELRDVSFAYNEPEWVLKNISFRVDRGERVALVGHTGAAGRPHVVAAKLSFANTELRVADSI